MSASMNMMKQKANMQNQGIVTILGPENRADSTSSLRRTLSADMSSKKWRSQSGFSLMKKIASSDELSLSNPKIVSDSFSSSEEDEYEAEAERGQDEIWDSIQRNKKAQQEKAAGQFDTWSSILSQKADDDVSKSLPPPYIHPLVKRSRSSLSEKSLEICTESLGSETGSDGFSSHQPSENGDSDGESKEDDQEQQQQPPFEAEVELLVPKYNSAAASKKSPPRSFPPPIPSLSRQDSSSLHMRPHRDNGRLVLQAVSVPSQNNFRAQRQDGRLVLTFADLFNNDESKEDAGEVSDEEGVDNMEDFEEEFGGFEEDENDNESEEGEEVEEIDSDENEIRSDVESVIEEEAPVLSNGFQSVKGLALMMTNKPIGLVNRSPKRSEKSNEAVNFEDVNVKQPTSVAAAQSLPPRPRMARLIPSAPAVASAAAAAASLNDYDYYWRSSKSTTTKAASVLNPFNTHHHQQNSLPLKNNSSKLIVSDDIHQTPNEQQKLVVRKLNSCKESRRYILFWEPHCIAT